MEYCVVRTTSNNNELYHHGVKGMKWGIRRFQNSDGSLTNAGRKRYATVGDDTLKAKKQEYKTAKKEYNRSFNKAYNRAVAAYSPIKKHREANDKRWDKAIKKAEILNTKKSEYKNAKKEYKEINKEALAARRKTAIKVGVAVAGTALATYGAYKMSKYLKSEAGKRCYESGKKYAQEKFFNRANIANPREYVRLYEEGARSMANTNARTQRISGSTIEAIKYLANPERYLGK